MTLPHRTPFHRNSQDRLRRYHTVSGSPYLLCRCAVSTFISNAQPLVIILSEDAKSARQDAQTPTKYTAFKNLIEELRRLTTEEWSPDLEKRRINTLVKNLLVAFLFPHKGLKIPVCLTKIIGLKGFRKYNWPLAVHKLLHGQIADLSRRSDVREDGENFGYLEGCSVVLLVWLYEHTKIWSMVDDIARPRICRWSSKLSYSAKLSFNLENTPRKDDQVKRKLGNIEEEEKMSLGEEPMDSDFEPIEKRRKINNLEHMSLMTVINLR